MCLKEALRRLGPSISERRKDRIASVIGSRSTSISLLLENVYNEANENAIIRSMDAMGCLQLHKLSTRPPKLPYISRWKHKVKFPPRTDAGARSWISIHQWSNVDQCISHLKEKHGYTLAVTSPAAQISISDLDFSQKLLVAFGNEVGGISDELLELSDINFSIPMCGFVESFNISVAVSLTLYHAYLHRMKNPVSIYSSIWHILPIRSK